jgi:L-amino acid N-acyltransferase YncA
LPAFAKSYHDIVTDQRLPYLVAVDGDTQAVLGYANAHGFRGVKGAYRHTVEITMFCHPDRTGKGVGSRLLGSLLQSLREKGKGGMGGDDAEVRQVLAVMAVDEMGKGNGLKLKEFYEGFGFQMVRDMPA